jgi:hypothetical protein
MSKGPVAIAQTLAPLAAFLLWLRYTRPAASAAKTPVAPILIAAAITLAIALPWPIYAIFKLSQQVPHWWLEITHVGDPTYTRDPVWSYLAGLPLLLPWMFFFIVGTARLIRARDGAGILAIMLTLVPILVMTAFKEKNERYLLPMLGPAAIVAAAVLMPATRPDERDWRRLALILTWITLGIIALALPISGAFAARVGGGAWWSPTTATLAAIIALAFIAIARFIDPPGERALFPATIILMLAGQALFMHGYRNSPRGRSDMKPLADAIVAALPPDAEVYNYNTPEHPSKAPIDMPIYLNRVLRVASNPTTLPTSGPRQVILLFRMPNEPVIAPLTSWPRLGQVPRNKGFWEAYAQPRP